MLGDRKPQLDQPRTKIRRVRKQHRFDSQRPRTRHVRRIVVDEHRIRRRQPESRQREPIDRRIGLHHLLLARYDDVAKPVEQLRFTRAEGRPELVAEVRDREQRYAGRVQLLDDLLHPGDSRTDALVESRPPGGDQRGMLRIQRGKLRRGVGEVAASVMLEVPVDRHDIAQERVERPIVVDQALVQDPRIPVVQDTTDVENDGGNQEVSPGVP